MLPNLTVRTARALALWLAATTTACAVSPEGSSATPMPAAEASSSTTQAVPSEARLDPGPYRLYLTFPDHEVGFDRILSPDRDDFRLRPPRDHRASPDPRTRAVFDGRVTGREVVMWSTFSAPGSDSVLTLHFTGTLDGGGGAAGVASQLGNHALLPQGAWTLRRRD